MPTQTIIRMTDEEYKTLRGWMQSLLKSGAIERDQITQPKAARLFEAETGIACNRNHVSRVSKKLGYEWPNFYIEKLKRERKPVPRRSDNGTSYIQVPKSSIEALGTICDVIADLCDALGYDLTDTDFARVHALSKTRS